MDLTKRDKEKQLAYILSENFKYSRSNIANMMGVSTQSVSSWVKDTGYEIKIAKLEAKVDNLEAHIQNISSALEEVGYMKPKELESKNIENIIDIVAIEYNKKED